MKVLYKETCDTIKITILGKVRNNKVEIFQYEYRGDNNRIDSFNIDKRITTKIVGKIEKVVNDPRCGRVFGNRFKKIARLARTSPTFERFIGRKVK